MPAKQETTHPAEVPDEEMKHSTVEKTGVKMSTLQITLVMLAICVRSFPHYSCSIADYAVLDLPGSFRCDYRHDGATNNIRPFSFVFSLHLGRCSLYPRRRSLNTGMGQGQRHLGT